MQHGVKFSRCYLANKLCKLGVISEELSLKLENGFLEHIMDLLLIPLL